MSFFSVPPGLSATQTTLFNSLVSLPIQTGNQVIQKSAAGTISSIDINALLGNGTRTGTVTGSPVLTLVGASGQTGNVFLVQNSAGATLFAVDNFGNLTIAGTATISINEAVTGNLTLTGNFTATGVSNFSDGTVSAPSITFTADTTTGFYRIGASNIGITLGGTNYFNISTTKITTGLIIQGTSTTNGVRLWSLNNTGTNAGALSIDDNVGVNLRYAGTQFLVDSSNLTMIASSNGYILFGPNNSYSGAWTTSGNLIVGYASATDPSTTSILSVNASKTITSAAGAVWNGVNFAAATATLSGSTNITTAAGFNAYTFNVPTITSGSAITVTNAATVYIAGPPVAAGSTTITNKASLVIGAGLTGFLTNAPTHTITLASTSTGFVSYNTADQTTNYERVQEYWSGNVYTIDSQKGGAGTARTISLSFAGTNALKVVSATSITSVAKMSVGADFNPTGQFEVGNTSVSRIFHVQNDGGAGFRNGGSAAGEVGSAMLRGTAGGVLQLSNNNLIFYNVLTDGVYIGSRVSTQFDKATNTTLSAITGLSATLVAGNTYAFRIVLHVTASAVGGSKYDLNGGSATATALIANYVLVDDTTNANTITSRQTTLAGSTGQAGTTTGTMYIDGLITVNAGGTFIPEFAQNVSNGTSSVIVGSNMVITQIA